ncbi:Peroxidase 45 [Dichanthelium oligosanthes]|uniref:Peroxidase n=1 Tax=Dichanthelium oligosanthes TaxID=888268 RepID=A0A1E5VUZ9_9POAL|nr:Peroxidase 45 [Dichanthelium oligosanthes]
MMRRLQFLTAFFLLALHVLSPSSMAVAQLRRDYYADVCPNLESIVRDAVRQNVEHSPVAAPATLRLFFHDCAVRGCDASIMLINPDGDDEWRSPDGMTLKPEGFNTVMSAKAAVDSDPQCRSRVSCADILALAARDSVFLSGGPDYQVELGRFDGRVSTVGSVLIPHGTFNLDQLNAFFSGLGLSQTDMIALSGGHTIGAASCGFFGNRMGGDAAMDPAFADQLRGSCPGASAAGFAFLDATTPLQFDNEYYRSLRAGRGLLASDQALYADPRSRGAVDRYADDQGAFFRDFAAAMTRLGRVGVRTAADGEVRRDCRFPN